MDKLLLTDSSDVFESSGLTNKVLFKYHLPSVIVSSSFLSEKEVAQINDNFFIDFLKRGDRITKKLRDVSLSLDVPKIPLNNITDEEWKIGLCHALLEEKFERKFLVQDLVESFKTKYNCELELRDSGWDQSKGRIQLYKNKLYFLFDIKRWSQPKKSFDYVYMLTNASHHFELLENVIKQQISNGESVGMVIYPTQLGDTKKSKRHIPKGVKVFEIQNFRGYPKFRIDRKQWKGFENLNFDSVEANYTMMLNMLSALSPGVCLTMGYQNHTRYLAQSCAHFKIPSISIDYSFITDDYRFERSIKYDHRISISKAQVDIWKKRNDPTLNHHTIGYLKYDDVDHLDFDRNKFGKSHDFQFDKTVLFASSYGFDNTVKSDLINFLSTYCNSNDLNFLIKKHPLETDQVPDTVLENNNFKSQVVLTHDEITALEAIKCADVVLSQGSSIVLDALYFSKPFITYATGNLSITDLMPLGKEKFLLSASNFEELEKAIEAGINTRRKELIDEIERKRSYYLGDMRGESSICLVNILKGIKEGV